AHGQRELRKAERRPIALRESRRMPKSTPAVSAQGEYVAHERRHLVHGLQRLEHQCAPVHVAQLRLGEEGAFVQALTEEGGSEERDGKREEARERDLRRAHYEIELLPEVTNMPSHHVQYEAVREHDACLEALRDQGHWGVSKILQLVGALQPRGVEGLD